MAGIDTRSFLDQFIVSITSIDIELRKRLLNRRMPINGGRTWLLYCVVAFVYKDDDLVPIRMNVISFLLFLLPVTIVNLEVDISTSYTSYWLKNAFHLTCSPIYDIFPLINFWRIRPHVLIIDKKRHYYNLNNSHKLPILLSDMLYQCNGGSKLSIDMISGTNAFRALVKEYLLSTIGSGMLFCLNLVRTKRRLSVTVSSLDDNELFMTKCRYFNDRIIFKADMKVNKNKGVTMRLQR